MSDSSQFSRRERQIMNILYAEGGATVATVLTKLVEPATDVTVRRLMHILEDKGHVKRLRKEGREVVYAPTQSKARAGLHAWRQMLNTFFNGAVDEALAAHFTRKDASLTDEQATRMQKLIDQAKREGR